MIKPEIILVGGGGHCKSCIDVIEQENKLRIRGIIDLPHLIHTDILGYKVIGNDEDLPILAKKGLHFLITLGHMGNAKRRGELFQIIKQNGGKLPQIISPEAYVSKYASIGEGSIIMHHSLINTTSKVGNNTIINSKALVEHDVVIGDNCHISTAAIINGNCTISDNCFIGSSSVIKNGLGIAKDCFIGLGAVVIKSIDEKGLYFGNPAKKIESL
jgi:sugar O-acyltransferase (sialic acid O-acetyltransferase NeuD family)